MYKQKLEVVIPFVEFCKQETVLYCLKQLRSSKFKNIKPAESLSSTQKTYAYAIWRFNNWLAGKDFEFFQLNQISSDSFKREKKNIQLQGLEHFFKIFVESHNSDQEFAKVIKQYLLSPGNKEKRASTIDLDQCAIKAYFEKNDSPINFNYNSKATHKITDEDDDQPILTLDDILKMLTTGRPTVTQKAMILCKFHRGLDTSTFVDRFNFQSWPQLVDWFGTEEYRRWDLDKCPVPIKLTRIKTGFVHTGFLERDAVSAIQDYLDWRAQSTGRAMQDGDSLFVTFKKVPYTIPGFRRTFQKLAKNSGIQRKLHSYNLRERYQKDSHEMRDLLKSILIDCGCRIDAADHFIGHRQKDSYEKQATLFPENLREEYMKASSKLNIFSNISRNMQKSVSVHVLQNKVTQLQEIVDRLQQKDMIRDSIIPTPSKNMEK